MLSAHYQQLTEWHFETLQLATEALFESRNIGCIEHAIEL
jgi:hypothetical protein